MFKQILVIDGWGISCEIVLIWMSLDLTDLCRHMVSLGHNELMSIPVLKHQAIGIHQLIHSTDQIFTDLDQLQ